MDLKNNDNIDFYRKPVTKDQPAWIGAATIVDLSDIERGYVGAKYNNRLLTLSTQDVRQHHSYLAGLLVTPVYNNLLRHIRRSLTSLPPGKLQFISESHPLWQPIKEYARGILGIHYVRVIRIGLGVATLPQSNIKDATTGTTVIWKHAAYRPYIHDYDIDNGKLQQISLREQFPEHWQNISILQLLSAEEEDSPAVSGSRSGDGNRRRQGNSHSPDGPAERLPTIPEESDSETQLTTNDTVPGESLLSFLQGVDPRFAEDLQNIRVDTEDLSENQETQTYLECMMDYHLATQ
jgi:hypothetical protein